MKTKRQGDRSIMLPGSSQLSPEIVDQLEQLFASSPAQAYRDTLLEIYHLYIMREHEHLPVHFDAMAANMYALTEFLRIVELEMQKRKPSPDRPKPAREM